MQITSDQLRAARSLLRLEQAELARRADVSVITIRRLEASGGGVPVGAATLGTVKRALEEAGAEFIADGVRRRRTAQADAEALYEDLRVIGLASAERQRGREQWTEADLYDEDGLPA